MGRGAGRLRESQQFVQTFAPHFGLHHHAGPAADWRIIHRMMHIVGPVAQVVRLDLQQSLGLGFAHQAEFITSKYSGNTLTISIFMSSSLTVAPPALHGHHYTIAVMNTTMNLPTRKKPEVLSPAGNLRGLKTAVDYGADAVYCGGKAFGMRSAPKP